MSQSQPIRIAFVLTELTLGGAEMMLWKLLSRIDRSRFDPFIFALSGHADVMLDRFNDIGVNCSLLGMKPRFDAVAGLLRLAQKLRTLTPDIVQGWLYHGNVAATLGSALVYRRSPVLWSIRCTLPHRLLQEKWQSALTIGLGSVLSFSATKIIHNSHASAIEHEQRLGYRRRERIVLPNGFDTDVFRPSTAAALSLRQELGMQPDAILIGLVGRYHAMKDHPNFLRAAALLKTSHPDVHFVLAGERVDALNATLVRLVTEHGLTGRVHLLGRRDDVHVITAALDIACSSSAYGEGFANIIGEAMSCATPCVVTDVGDSAYIVDTTGRVVPPRAPEALAQALSELVELGAAGRKALGARARQRIVTTFSLDAVVRRYEALYLEVYEKAARAREA